MLHIMYHTAVGRELTVIAQQPVRATLDELRYLASLHGSFLFAFNALIPLYPVGRFIGHTGVPGGGKTRDLPGWLPSWLSGRLLQFTRNQLEILVILVAIGVVLVFVPLYVRLLISALPGQQLVLPPASDEAMTELGR